jgi:hypothetical protein
LMSSDCGGAAGGRRKPSGDRAAGTRVGCCLYLTAPAGNGVDARLCVCVGSAGARSRRVDL